MQLATMSDIDKKWYVVRAISGQEKKIKDVLEAEVAAAGLQHYVGQILIPVEKVFQIRNGQKGEQGTQLVSWLHLCGGIARG